jgi:uncharacterized membrane protein YhfC
MIQGKIIAALVVSTASAILTPVALFAVLRKRMRLKVAPAIVGALAFVLGALVLESIVHALVLKPDGVSGKSWMQDYPVAYVTYAATMAGVFEETARYVSFKSLFKKYPGKRTGISYGIGHGGVESILLTGVGMAILLVTAIKVNAGDASAADAWALGNYDAVGPGMILAGGIERLSAISLHLGLSMIVYRSVYCEKSFGYYPLAILLHALVDVIAAVYQVGLFESIALLEGVVAAEGVAVLILGLRLAAGGAPREGEELSATDVTS